MTCIYMSSEFECVKSSAKKKVPMLDDVAHVIGQFHGVTHLMSIQRIYSGMLSIVPVKM